ncbi:MAG: ATP synthase F1 subunit epsilon [Coriobacteriia bacterium]|nr:ATP synthase F1 subunit epsilon [Coriobacteriia bacterium]
MSTFSCEIVTPEKSLFSDQVYFVSVPASEGEIGILARRAPVMSTLKLGVVRVKREEQGESLAFAVAGGYVEADGRQVVVLADRAEAVGKLDLEQVQLAKAENEKKFAALSEGDSRSVFFRDEIAWYTLLENQLTNAL